jgi:hypothetical protein
MDFEDIERKFHQKRGRIRDPRSGIRKKFIPDPGSRGYKSTGSRIRLRNTVSMTNFLTLTTKVA